MGLRNGGGCAGVDVPELQKVHSIRAYGTAESFAGCLCLT